MDCQSAPHCSFVKYHGNGNDFILIDRRLYRHNAKHRDFRKEGSQYFHLEQGTTAQGQAPIENENSEECPVQLKTDQDLIDPSWIQKICDRHCGIGGDGVIFLEDSASADYRMRIFNSDGGEASMCGNGIRCLILFIQKLGDTRSEWEIETLKNTLCCRREKEDIIVNLGIPTVLHWPESGKRGGALFVIDTGVPHAVMFKDDLAQVAVEMEGRRIRYASEFSPDGVNVNFVAQKGPRQWAVRTYERGVEKETMACGTGAAAVAFVVARLFGEPLPIEIFPLLAPQMEGIQFQFFPSSCGKWEISMRGRAQEVFVGQVPFPSPMGQ